MGVFLLVVHPLYTNLDEQTYPVFYMYVQICFVLIRNKILSDQNVSVSMSFKRDSKSFDDLQLRLIDIDLYFLCFKMS